MMIIRWSSYIKSRRTQLEKYALNIGSNYIYNTGNHQIINLNLFHTYMPQPKESFRIRSFQHYFLRNIGSYQHQLLWQIGFCKKVLRKILIRKLHPSSNGIPVEENLKIPKGHIVIEEIYTVSRYGLINKPKF